MTGSNLLWYSSGLYKSHARGQITREPVYDLIKLLNVSNQGREGTREGTRAWARVRARDKCYGAALKGLIVAIISPGICRGVRRDLL